MRMRSRLRIIVVAVACSLGAGDDVVGVTDFTDWPAEARKRPSVGGIVNPSIEKLVSLRPDLVIATREVNRKETIDELDRLGIPVFVVDPQGLAGVIVRCVNG